MLSIQRKYVANSVGPCSDCGKMSPRLTRGVDQHTCRRAISNFSHR